MKTVLVAIACLLAASGATTGRESVTVRVSPNVSMAPATVRVVVTVEPHADNRELVVEADSGSFFTSSTVELDGERAARIQAFTLKELPAGDYSVAARVVQKDGSRQKASAEYMVLE